MARESELVSGGVATHASALQVHHSTIDNIRQRAVFQLRHWAATDRDHLDRVHTYGGSGGTSNV